MSELLERLKHKYPFFRVQSEPSATCVCGGRGEKHVNGNDYPCLCVCMSGPGELRGNMARSLRDCARKMRKESR